jgi:hypothetical protein
MTYEPDQFRRLPKWAQREINRLQNEVDWWKAKATVGPNESNTFAERGEKPLGIDPTVIFHIDEHRDRLGDSIEARLEGNRLRLVTPNGMLSIHPHASNVAYVTVRDDS